MKINIAGGGIGGLVAALALHEDGHEVRVYESASELRALGVGINLLPQAVTVLCELGLMDDLLAQGVATRELSYFNMYGQLIWTESRGKFAGFPSPQISTARGGLQMVLLNHALDRLGPDAVVTGHALTGFRTMGETAVATLKTPSGGLKEVESEILICADGIHSAARRQLHPNEGLPVYSGRILWRATSFAPPFKSGATMFMAGHENQKFVCYPIAPVRDDGLQLINWIAELRRPFDGGREDWNRKVGPETFLPQFEPWTFDWLDIPGLIRSAEQIYEFPMVDRDPVETWTEGRVTLLGDAAHAMYPIGSNGASQAILDVATLAKALRSSDNAPGALSTYESERLPATAAIIRANRANGPEQCMQMAHERAPNGFNDIGEVFAAGELQKIADQYKVLTGMKKQDA